ncbi:SPFH domain-containing protein [Lysinibacillus sp. fls2-241-R2A-57]|uniref:SPFH domain-containing protein n=1 Tax=Lysinibacillus sp. fls2-241-R2A-57 TaxID=3040292 RepID=UPI0025560889|nr:SPFH domain-containing protein [Lysinibacillus sp. fls2-241-R2A-57]
MKFDGLRSRDWLIYKHPTEKLVLGTTLIVNEGQVAIFVKGGQICDVFNSGTHVLSTNNLPLLHHVVNFAYGGDTPFSAEIYFINLSVKLDLYWGTSDPIQLIDPKYFVKLRIRAFGQLALRLDDYLLFFTEVIGSMNKDDIVSFEKVQDYFKGSLITSIKTELANKIINEKISALEITTELHNISNSLKGKISEEFNTYGFIMAHFHIQSINFPEEDFDKINQILQDKAKFEIMGDNRYVTQRSFDIYESAASNENGVAGLFASSGVGLGVGQGMITMMNQQVQQPGNNITHIICPSCHGNILSTSKFCNLCGENLTRQIITCHSCQSENEESSKFCCSCGISLHKPVCSCGQELDVTSKFCNNCGTQVKSIQ